MFIISCIIKAVIKMNKVEEKVIETLNKIRPYLNHDGGDVEFKKFENGIVYVKLTGACHGCAFADLTIKNTIEEMLLMEVPEVIRVEAFEEA